MTGHDRENASPHVAGGYLRELLADGARPFLFRERVRSLLGAEGGWPGTPKTSSYRFVVLQSPGPGRALPTASAPVRNAAVLEPFDAHARTRKAHISVNPAQAGIREAQAVRGPLDTRFRGYDDFFRKHQPFEAGNSIEFMEKGVPEKVAEGGDADGKRLNLFPGVQGRKSSAGGSAHFTGAGKGKERDMGIAADAGEGSGTEESRPTRSGAVRQGGREDTIVIPGITGGRGAFHPEPEWPPEWRGPSPVTTDAEGRGKVGRSLGDPPEEGEKAPCVKDWSGGGIALDLMPEPVPRGVAGMPGSRREIFSAMEEAFAIAENGLPAGNERNMEGNMAGALRTLEDHLRQKIEQLREASARRPDSAAPVAAPEVMKEREAGESAPPRPAAKERVVVVGRAPRRPSAPAAFWERSYLGRLSLRPLR